MTAGASERGGRARGPSPADLERTADRYASLAHAFAPPYANLADDRGSTGAALPTGDSAALEVEHTRLFVGPGRVPASPYGSVYLDGGALMGESTADALRHYREAGFVLAPETGMLPDHLVVELSFLSVLAEEAARAIGAGDWAAARLWLGRRGAFLCDHLGAWAPPLAEAVLAATNEPLYRAAAVSLRELVAADLETLLATVGDPAEAPAAPAP